MEYRTKRQRHLNLKAQLESEVSSFKPHWREAGEHVFPRRLRFTTSDINRGDRRNSKIIDSTATLSARTLRSGMMGGVTSPARPWFRLTHPDPNVNEISSVKSWLHAVSQAMSTVYLRSNLYNVLPILYGDLGVVGTAAMMVEEDMDDVIRCYPFAIGSYRIAVNAKLRVDTFSRTFKMTVRQLVEMFADRKPDGTIIWDNLSDHVKSQWEAGNTQSWVEVEHIIEPNDKYDEKKIDAKFKKFRSCYFESGTSGGKGSHQGSYVKDSDGDIYLREKGYSYFPVLVPRWEVTGEDSYGTSCPGMDALGDIKQLQLGEKRIAQALELLIKPPMKGPVELQNQKTSTLPGDLTISPEREGQRGYMPVFQIDPRVQEMEGKQEQIRQRIRRAFYEDLFLMLANTDRREITAREIEERHEEKLLALGPVLEQLNQDLLDPLIDITFEIMMRQGLIPAPPKELTGGTKLKVEYISVMAQAQKAIGISGVERFAGFVGQLMAFAPEIKAKVKVDQWVDVYADMTSVPPSMVASDDEAAETRGGEARAQQQAQMAEKLSMAAGAAKDLSGADLEGDNALKRMIEGANAGNLTKEAAV